MHIPVYIICEDVLEEEFGVAGYVPVATMMFKERGGAERWLNSQLIKQHEFRNHKYVITERILNVLEVN